MTLLNQLQQILYVNNIRSFVQKISQARPLYNYLFIPNITSTFSKERSVINNGLVGLRLLINDTLKDYYGISETLVWFTIIIHHDFPVRALGRNIEVIRWTFTGMPHVYNIDGWFTRTIEDIVCIENVGSNIWNNCHVALPTFRLEISGAGKWRNYSLRSTIVALVRII